MCEECTSAEHAEHATVPLKDVLEQHKASLQEQLDAVKNRHVTYAHVHIAIEFKFVVLCLSSKMSH